MDGLRYSNILIEDPVFLFSSIEGKGLAQIKDWGLGECSLIDI